LALIRGARRAKASEARDEREGRDERKEREAPFFGKSGATRRVHMSPTMRAHENPYGKYTFDVRLLPASPTGLRPLRTPGLAA
jgi:hypothetical protein